MVDLITKNRFRFKIAKLEAGEISTFNRLIMKHFGQIEFIELQTKSNKEKKQKYRFVFFDTLQKNESMTSQCMQLNFGQERGSKCLTGVPFLCLRKKGGERGKTASASDKNGHANLGQKLKHTNKMCWVLQLLCLACVQC